jgi:bleomycin hydrolase
LITQESRQEAFDLQQTTDDHGMHIVGLYKEKSTGMEYYLVKNSWGTVNNLSGYIFVSKPYFQYKTISVMIHQDGVK